MARFVGIAKREIVLVPNTALDATHASVTSPSLSMSFLISSCLASACSKESAGASKHEADCCRHGIVRIEEKNRGGDSQLENAASRSVSAWDFYNRVLLARRM
jgi:hypothetical protein